MKQNSSLQKLRKEIRSCGSKQRADISKRFFKTGKGEYAEGDQFLGITVPVCRGIAKRFSDANLKDIEILLTSRFHEERLIALLLLVDLFSRKEHLRKKIFATYVKNSCFVNNWDLVDVSAPLIFGAQLSTGDRSIRDRFARSRSLFERRIAIVSTLFDIGKGESSEALRIAEILLSDTHDLIHKAVGWMLREVGKRCSETILENFIQIQYARIPRTTLRYAIERFPEGKRKKYLAGTF